MSLWTAKEAESATGGHAIGDWTCDGVSIDTRTLAPGDLFVALKDVRDGHDFVAMALEKGAAAALVTHVPEGVAEDAPLLIVEDVLKGLEALGAAARARTQAKVVAVTGSVGKTSTKEMLLAIFADQGRAHASVDSYNNHWGVPLTLARMPADTEYAVIEIGMNHPGEIAPLAALAQLDVALITTVAAAHMEAFDGIEGIAAEKAALMDGLVANGIAVLPADIDTAPVLLDRAARLDTAPILFGRSAKDGFRLTGVQAAGGQTVVSADTPTGPLVFKLATPGTHFAMNGLGALAAAQAAGADLAVCATDLAGWHPVAGRGARETVRLDKGDPDVTLDLIDDSYNANPASMGAALDMLAASEPRDGLGRVRRGRRIAVLGDMRELGADATALHAALAAHPAMARIDRVHCVGPLSRALHEALPEEKRGLATDTSADLAAAVHGQVDAGDVVLIKASLGTGLARVVDAIRKLGQAGPQD